MHCHQVNQLLVDYLDGDLDNMTSEELTAHLNDCAPCKKFIESYKATIRLTKKIEPSSMPPELKDKLHAFIKSKISS